MIRHICLNVIYGLKHLALNIVDKHTSSPLVLNRYEDDLSYMAFDSVIEDES